MIIDGIGINPGETKKIEVNIAQLPSHSPIDLNITVSRSKADGPTLLLSGGLHGDEINGIEIVRRIIDQNLHVPLIGTVICIPIINIYGFIHFSRYVPDGKDVNRSFPGSKTGSLASRVAHFMTKEILPKIDYGVDFHTGGADRTNFPQTRAMMNDAKNVELANAFQAPFSMHSAYRPKSMRKIAAKLKKNILVYEGGESSRFDEYAIQEGIDGTIRLMNFLGMRNDATVPIGQPTISIEKSSWVRAKVSGLFQKMVESGDKVSKNQILGHLTDPFGDFTTPIKSPKNAYVLAINNNPILHQGDAILHLGTTNKLS